MRIKLNRHDFEKLCKSDDRKKVSSERITKNKTKTKKDFKKNLNIVLFKLRNKGIYCVNMPPVITVLFSLQ